ncbi:MAG TPA: acyl carrier protein, partial [Anaerolineales bacterium]|nr:acyl carrier protein [Anaerolineales bacterium]
IAENILFSGKTYPHPDEMSFLENGIVDSMGVMQLVLFVEEAFDINIDDSDLVPDNFDSISKLAAYIRRKDGQ